MAAEPEPYTETRYEMEQGDQLQYDAYPQQGEQEYLFEGEQQQGVWPPDDLRTLGASPPYASPQIDIGSQRWVVMVADDRQRSPTTIANRRRSSTIVDDYRRSSTHVDDLRNSSKLFGNWRRWSMIVNDHRSLSTIIDDHRRPSTIFADLRRR